VLCCRCLVFIYLGIDVLIKHTSGTGQTVLVHFTHTSDSMSEDVSDVCSHVDHGNTGSCPVLSCLVFVLSCLVLSCLVLSCLVLVSVLDLILVLFFGSCLLGHLVLGLGLGLGLEVSCGLGLALVLFFVFVFC
jgi:hypothetical protein